jgi:hypothetical protein
LQLSARCKADVGPVAAKSRLTVAVAVAVTIVAAVVSIGAVFVAFWTSVVV